MRFFQFHGEQEQTVFDVTWSQRQLTVREQNGRFAEQNARVGYAMEDAPSCVLGEFSLSFDILQWRACYSHPI